MKRGSRNSLAATLAVALIAGAVAAGTSRGAGGPVACTLATASQLQSILGLEKSVILSRSSPTVAMSECDWGVWSGATPSSPAAVLQTAKSGRGALLGIETWAAPKSKPDRQKWITGGYARLKGQLTHEIVSFPGLFASHGASAHVLRLSRLGYSAKAFQVALQGRAKGLIVAVGCWWNDKKSSVICIADEEAAGKPANKHLNQIASAIVAKFLR